MALLHDAYPDNISLVSMDLTCRDSVESAEEMLNKRTDHLDTLIACYGECEFDGELRLSADIFERVTHTNYLGVVEAVRVALPFLRQSENTVHIVGVGSLSSGVPFPGAAAYGASSAALDYFFQSLKLDLDHDKIDVSIVRLGFSDASLFQENNSHINFNVSSKQSAEKILCVLKRRQLFFDIPFRLSFSLKVMRLLPFVWIKFIAPKFREVGIL